MGMNTKYVNIGAFINTLSLPGYINLVGGKEGIETMQKLVDRYPSIYINEDGKIVGRNHTMYDHNNKVIVYSGNIARRLLKDPNGYRIIDIAPNKHDPERKSSVFIFEYKQGIFDAIKKIHEHYEEIKSEGTNEKTTA